MAPTKRALIVGCNYPDARGVACAAKARYLGWPGTEAALRGCVNDAMAIEKMLVTHYGFDRTNITMLVDTDKSKPQPTGANIKKTLKQLVQASKAGDVLVFHYSGHGTQVADKGGGEADNLDEAICPTDMNLICDDDLRAIFDLLAKDVLFTMISDCCHSGSMLDHPVQQISGDKDPNSPEGVDTADPKELMSSFFKGAKGADDAKNRALPQDLFAKILGSKLGKVVDPSQVKVMLAKGFGDDASTKMLSAAGMLKGQLDKMAAGGGQHAQKAGMLSKILSALPCFSSPQAGSASGGGGGVAGVPGQSGAGGKPSGGGTEHKGPGTGVLITGCQSNETSADACPSGDPDKAFGALTNALTTTIDHVKKRNPKAAGNNKFIVTEVRKTLLKAKFEQNPCLECQDSMTTAPFICKT